MYLRIDATSTTSGIVEETTNASSVASLVTIIVTPFTSEKGAGAQDAFITGAVAPGLEPPNGLNAVGNNIPGAT